MPLLQCAMLAMGHLDPAALTPAFIPCVCTWTAQKAECLLGVTACPGLTVQMSTKEPVFPVNPFASFPVLK